MSENLEYKDATEQSPPTVSARRPRSKNQYIPGQSSKDLARRAALLQENLNSLLTENHLHRLNIIRRREEPSHNYNEDRLEDWLAENSELFCKSRCDESNNVQNAKEDLRLKEISEIESSLVWLANPEMKTNTTTNTTTRFEKDIQPRDRTKSKGESTGAGFYQRNHADKRPCKRTNGNRNENEVREQKSSQYRNPGNGKHRI